jgi:hypothetical protein
VSRTSRTARSRTSGENLFVVLLMMLHPTQELEPPANPARFKPAGRWPFEGTLQVCRGEAMSGIPFGSRMGDLEHREYGRNPANTMTIGAHSAAPFLGKGEVETSILSCSTIFFPFRSG